MKKKLLIILILILLLGVGIIFYLNNTKFYLEDEYYGNSKMVEIDKFEFDKLIEDKESFGIFVYQPLCYTSSSFSDVVDEYQKKYGISFYKISYSSIKESDKVDFLKYYPSFIIYKNGKMVDYLDANSNEDTSYYKNDNDFGEWFNSYVKFKSFNYDKTTTNNVITTKVTEEVKDVELSDLKYSDKKVNIYFFWGDGCSHCKNAKNFFKSIEKDYGDMYTLNYFEVWNNEENQKLLETFSSAMEDEISGVPYIIIGDESFKGYGSNMDKDIIDSIERQYKNSFDVYFDKIKK